MIFSGHILRPPISRHHVRSIHRLPLKRMLISFPYSLREVQLPESFSRQVGIQTLCSHIPNQCRLVVLQRRAAHPYELRNFLWIARAVGWRRWVARALAPKIALVHKDANLAEDNPASLSSIIGRLSWSNSCRTVSPPCKSNRCVPSYSCMRATVGICEQSVPVPPFRDCPVNSGLRGL